MQKTEERGNHKGSIDGVIKLEGQGGLAREFLSIGRDFDEALGRCVLRDDNQRNAIILYKAQLEMFELWEEIQELTSWLNASAAVGGFNRSLAAMTETGIFIAEGAGIKLSKENAKMLTEIQRAREAAKNKIQEEGDNK